jgi:hypothetical protein
MKGGAPATSGTGRLRQRLGASLARRLAFGQGHPLTFRLGALFMSKARRRAFFDALEPPGSAALAAARRDGAARDRRLAALLPELLDAGWYATAHGLPAPRDARRHYLATGRHAGLAPALALAGPDGRRLGQAGAERLLRAGAEAGTRATGLLAPDDAQARQAMALTNPRGVALAVVTANFGGIAPLLPADPAWAARADFLLFTDRVFPACGPWQAVHANYHSIDPFWRARFVKTHLSLYLARYEAALWVDDGILICRDPSDIVRPDMLPDTSTGAGLAGFAAEAPGAVLDPRVFRLRPGAAESRSLGAAWWRGMMARLDAAGPEIGPEAGPDTEAAALTAALAEAGIAPQLLPGGPLAHSRDVAARAGA